MTTLIREIHGNYYKIITRWSKLKKKNEQIYLGCCNPDGTMRAKKRLSAKEFRDSFKYKLKRAARNIRFQLTGITT